MFESFNTLKENIPLKTGTLFALMAFMQSCGNMDKKDIAQAIEQNPQAAHLGKSDLQKLLEIVHSAKNGSLNREKGIGGSTIRDGENGSVLEISCETGSFVQEAVNKYSKGNELTHRLSAGGIEYNIRNPDGSYVKKDRLHVDSEGNIFFQVENTKDKTISYAEIDSASGFILIGEKKIDNKTKMETYHLEGASTNPELGGELLSEVEELVHGIDGLKKNSPDHDDLVPTQH